MSATIQKRMTISLTARDLNDLRIIRSAPEHVVDIDAEASESQWVHAVLAEGMRAVKDRIAEQAYAEMATDSEVISASEERRARLSGRARGVQED